MTFSSLKNYINICHSRIKQIALGGADHDLEVAATCGLLKFPGRRQRDTQVSDVRGAVELIMLLPGRQAAQVRRQADELLVRYLGGDLRLVDEVCQIFVTSQPSWAPP